MERLDLLSLAFAPNLAQSIAVKGLSNEQVDYILSWYPATHDAEKWIKNNIAEVLDYMLRVGLDSTHSDKDASVRIVAQMVCDCALSCGGLARKKNSNKQLNKLKL